MTFKPILSTILIILTKQQLQVYANNVTKFGNTSTEPIGKEIINCSYENTINITETTLLSNGSYIYDNETLIPPDLVGNYDYEILYNDSRRSVPQHKRACICHLKTCITFCSNIISDTYNYVVENNMSYALDMFSIEMTLKNQTVVTKNIARDFMPNVLNEFCEASYILSPEENSWTLDENGNLQLPDNKIQLKRNQYCIDIHKIITENETYDFISPTICGKKRIKLDTLEKFNYWVQVISVIFLLLTIILYCCLTPLSIHGKLIISYSSNLALSFTIFCFINLSEKIFDRGPCLFMAYVNHFTQLSHFTWLGILCYDSQKTITHHDHEASYLKYSVFGYILPLLMTLFTMAAQNLIIDDAWRPGISIERCGLSVKWSATIYFYGPCLIILLYCLTTFISVYWTAIRSKKQFNKVKLNGPKKISYNSNWRIWQMMVICWFLEILSYVLHRHEFKISSKIIDYINSLQGVYIFFIIIGQKEVRNSFKKRYFSKKYRRERQNEIKNNHQRRMQSARTENSEYLYEQDE